MEASVRLLHSSHPFLRRTFKPPSLSLSLSLSLSSSFPPRHHHHPPLFLKPQASIHSSTPPFAHIFSSSSPTHPPFLWHHSLKPRHPPHALAKDDTPVVTAVLLGWLGSQEKHLRRYVELYRERGVHCVTFVAGVGDVLSFDMGRRLEQRIAGLADELARWVTEKEVDGKERVLMFHTFSNTGWLA